MAELTNPELTDELHDALAHLEATEAHLVLVESYSVAEGARYERTQEALQFVQAALDVVRTARRTLEQAAAAGG